MSTDAGHRPPPRRRRVWPLALAGALLGAVVLLYATQPPPTALVVQVVDANTGAPLAEAEVIARLPGQDPLPSVTTGSDGLARFEFFEAQAGYHVQVQKIDYDRWLVDGVSIPGEQETVLSAPLVSNPGGRVFVGLAGGRVVQADVASLRRIQTVVLPVASGSSVQWLRLHPSLDLLYAATEVEGKILSSLTGATLAPFDVQPAAIDGLEVSADGRYVLVTGNAQINTADVSDQRHLWFLDAETGALISDTILSQTESRVTVEWQPDGMDAQVLLATNLSLDRATVSTARYGPGNTAFRARGYPDRLNLSATNPYLYAWVAGMYSPEAGKHLDALVMLSTMDGMAVYQEVAPGVVALANSPVKEELYVLNEPLGTLSLIDLTDEGRQAFVPVGKQPMALTVSGDGRRVYVVNKGGPALVVVDVATMRVIESIPLPAEPLSVAVH